MEKELKTMEQRCLFAEMKVFTEYGFSCLNDETQAQACGREAEPKNKKSQLYRAGDAKHKWLY